MTEQLLRRVAALEEASSYAPALRVVIAEIGETTQAALLRERVNPDAGQQVLVVVFG
jgi:hypothetical protein